MKMVVTCERDRRRRLKIDFFVVCSRFKCSKHSELFLEWRQFSEHVVDVLHDVHNIPEQCRLANVLQWARLHLPVSAHFHLASTTRTLSQALSFQPQVFATMPWRQSPWARNDGWVSGLVDDEQPAEDDPDWVSRELGLERLHIGS